MITLVIEGRPASKKNGKDALQREGARYRAWARAAVMQLQLQWKRTPTITKPVRLSCVFYEHPVQRFDLAGVFQAICDVLQEAGVLQNDRLVRGTGPMDIRRDRSRPRVVITLDRWEEEGCT